MEHGHNQHLRDCFVVWHKKKVNKAPVGSPGALANPGSGAEQHGTCGADARGGARFCEH